MEKKFDIDNLAKLTRINLSDSEKSKIQESLGQILDYVEQLNEIDTSNVEPTCHLMPLRNVCRKDIVAPRDKDVNYLDLAPQKNKGHYEVPQVIS